MRKTGWAFHRIDEKVMGLIDKIRQAIHRESGISITKAQAVELAIEELAKAKKVRR